MVDALNLLQNKYLEGDFDECLYLIDQKFTSLKTNYTFTEGNFKSNHKCSRNSKCDCV